MAKRNKNWGDSDNGFDDIQEAVRKPRMVKYFVTFQDTSIQPVNIERIEKDCVVNQNSAGGEDDVFLYQLIVRLKDYPFVLIFEYPREDLRDKADVELQELMRQNRISI